MRISVLTLAPIMAGAGKIIPAGKDIEIDADAAIELRDLGRVTILDPEFVDERDAPESLSGIIHVLSDPDLVANLAKERDAALADAGELRKLADSATTEILQLKARIAELENAGVAAGAVSIGTREQPLQIDPATPAPPAPPAQAPAPVEKPRSTRKTKPAS